MKIRNSRCGGDDGCGCVLFIMIILIMIAGCNGMYGTWKRDVVAQERANDIAQTRVEVERQKIRVELERIQLERDRLRRPLPAEKK